MGTAEVLRREVTGLFPALLLDPEDPSGPPHAAHPQSGSLLQGSTPSVEHRACSALSIHSLVHSSVPSIICSFIHSFIQRRFADCSDVWGLGSVEALPTPVEWVLGERNVRPTETGVEGVNHEEKAERGVERDWGLGGLSGGVGAEAPLGFQSQSRVRGSSEEGRARPPAPGPRPHLAHALAPPGFSPP